MKTIFYIVGAQGSGKTTLANKIKKSREIHPSECTNLVAETLNEFDEYENICITTQVSNKKDLQVLRAISNCTDIQLIEINLH